MFESELHSAYAACKWKREVFAFDVRLSGSGQVGGTVLIWARERIGDYASREFSLAGERVLR